MKSNMIIKDIVFVFLIVSCAIAIASQPGHQADLNQQFLSAVIDNRAGDVKELLDQGADVNARDRIGRTALMRAVLHNHSAMVAQLLSAKADINAQMWRGTTVLHLAAWQGKFAFAEALLTVGADHAVCNDFGDTPLINAAGCIYSPSAETVRVLVQGCANVNHKNKVGNTPLCVAMRQGNSDSVMLLLRSGALYKDILDEALVVDTQRAYMLSQYVWSAAIDTIQNETMLPTVLYAIIKGYYGAIDESINDKED